MEKILVSSCLLGQAVRYDGQAQELENELLNNWRNEGRIVPFCPEVAGGLPIPRPAAEIVGNQVLTANHSDVTETFERGAELAVALCQKHQIRFALLKESSPSCGRNTIYDGTHSGNKIKGQGVTAKRLLAEGVQVFSEMQLPELDKALAEKA